MPKKKVCPRCKGRKKVVNPLVHIETDCGVCEGKGFVLSNDEKNVRFLLGQVRKIYGSL